MLAEEGLVASRQGVLNFIKKYEATGDIGLRGGAGRKNKISAEIRKLVDDRMMEDDETTVRELQKILVEHGHQVGATTILKCRTELGWTRRGAAYCQMIRDVNKEKRLDWARNNLGDDFSDCIFSDETSVQMETHRRFCCTKSGLRPRYKPKPKHPTKVHVWAAISKRGRSGICIFEGCMDAEAYVSILEQTLVPMIAKLYPNGHRFVQDNDPKHTSARAKQFFVDNGINWWHTPPESPDCNPIENLWHELKEFLRRVVKPKIKAELIQGIVSFWETVDVSKCQRYIGHLSKVVPRVIECNGGPTGF
jgi:transposase